MSRKDADHAEYFVRQCKVEREQHPLSPLPPVRKPKRRVSRDFATGAVDRYDFDGSHVVEALA